MTSFLPDSEWNKLLTLMDRGLIVPVIGPEILAVVREEQPAARLYDLWGQELARYRRMEISPPVEGVPLLYRS